MSPSRVVVVVPTLAGGARLARCLEGLAAQTMSADVLVVANGPVAGLDDLRGAVEVVRLPVNRGFTGGVNAGIARARAGGAELVALLNDDAVPEPGWLAALVGALDAHETCAAVTAKIRIAGTDRLDGAGDGYSVWGLPFPIGRGEVDAGQYDVAREVFSASGCAALYRMRMLDEVGGFDDRYFAYYEDVDLSFRARLAGWTIRCEPLAVVSHDLGGTSRGLGQFTTLHATKNLVFLYAKNMPGPLLVRYLPRFLVAFVGTSLQGARRGAGRAVATAWLTVARELPGVLRDRRHVQAARRVDVADIDRWLARRVPPRAVGTR